MNYIKIFLIISMTTLIYSVEKLFVACEGPFYDGQGSLSIITDLNEMTAVSDLGNAVQSVTTHEDKLFVISNGSNQIHVFEISEEGQELIHTIDTNGSGPRNMLIHNNLAYFTNWNSMDIKIMNMDNWEIINSITVDGLPEDIITDGENIWVSIPIKSDWSNNNIVIKLNPQDYNITEYEVGDGPGDLVYHDNAIYISRTFYPDPNDWYAVESGSSKIDMDGNISIVNYGSGVPCGGSVTKHNNIVYRSYDGGIAPLDENLNIMSEQKIGNFNFNNLYDVKSINNKIYFAITNYADINQVTVLDASGNELNTFDVGLIPTDFAIWDNTVLNNNKILISDFNISNAYPNPFNPSTTFELNISKPGSVSVQVFDLKGNVVDILANDFYTAGSYMMTWNAQNVASGIYILNAQLNDYNISQRITLVK